ncbi:hypothetical protein HanRHA438_Chr16g0766281 [Helianthus annuus]|nr:hypothetical protein HanRHA438_Chr16g0766281 [Helianthus annuus]
MQEVKRCSLVSSSCPHNLHKVESTCTFLDLSAVSVGNLSISAFHTKMFAFKGTQLFHSITNGAAKPFASDNNFFIDLTENSTSLSASHNHRSGF